MNTTAETTYEILILKDRRSGLIINYEIKPKAGHEISQAQEESSPKSSMLFVSQHFLTLIHNHNRSSVSEANRPKDVDGTSR